MQHDVFLSLGSNIGDRAENCLKAVEMLCQIKEIEFISQSSLYETDPVGYEDQSPFINMAVKIRTNLKAEDLLIHIKSVEKSIGRVKTFKWGPRLIDIDILLFSEEIISKPGLKVPHPAMTERAFVLVPLMEIGEDIKHPQLKQSIPEMAKKAPGREGVKRISG